MAEILRANNTRQEVSPKNGATFSLDELKVVVGGWVEAVHLDDSTLMLVNEEGRLMGLEYNQLASTVFLQYKGYYEPIVGDVLVCDINQMD